MELYLTASASRRRGRDQAQPRFEELNQSLEAGVLVSTGTLCRSIVESRAVSNRGIFYVIGLFLSLIPATADEIRVAVASNFAQVADRLASRYEETTDHQVALIPGSTGKHYAQIRNGAPFDVFLAADSRRPQMLQEDGLALADTCVTYAQGKLVLWSPDPDRVDEKGQVLVSGDFHRLAMANPDLAPYGRAASEVLHALGLAANLRDRIVRGENVGQTFQFVATGNAELGFVAKSQIVELDGGRRSGSFWEIPQGLYSPIDQQAVLLTDSDAARGFLEFLTSAEARSMIEQQGYASFPD